MGTTAVNPPPRLALAHVLAVALGLIAAAGFAYVDAPWQSYLACPCALIGSVAMSHILRWRETPVRLRVLLRDAGALTGRDLVARSNGWLRPGTVYVWLSREQDAGRVARAETEGRPPLYFLTPAGRAAC